MGEHFVRRLRLNGAIPWGALVFVASVVGYGLEAVRQRGTCEFGDPSPDTLVASVLLIVVGAGFGGLASVVAAVTGIIRHGWPARMPHLVLALLALASVAPMFAFAGAGPGSWFQYCAT
jgi:hypothetical protein